MRSTTREVVDRLDKDAVYPLRDMPNEADCERLGVRRHNVQGGAASLSIPAGQITGKPQKIKAIWTREYRQPMKGEWFLSGAIIEAYRAPADLGTLYHIAQLVLIEERLVQKVIAPFERLL